MFSLEDARVHQAGIHTPGLVSVRVRASRCAVEEILSTFFGTFTGHLRFARKFCVTSPKDLKAELGR